jgi:hypothetical protein
MKLSFRGASYEDNSPMLEVTEGEIAGKNRSQHGSFSYVRHIPVPPTMVHVRERDLSYRPRQTTADEPTLADRPAACESHKKWHFKNLQTKLDEADKTHEANIRSSLEHRLQIAKTKGDKKLVNLLEQESKQLPVCAFK